MKKLLLILFVAVLLVSGCAKETTYQKPAAPVSEPAVKQTTLPAEKETIKEAGMQGPVLPDDVKAIMAKADSVTSIDYSHSEWVKGEAGYYAHIYAKGDKMKHVIELGSGKFAKGTYYDTAYFDLAAKSVIAYCEEDTCDDRNAPIPVDFSDFTTETPFDVLKKVKYGAKAGTEMVDERETTIVQYDEDGKTIKVWLWDYKGLPLKYEVYSGDEKVKSIEYKTLVYNQVKDDELVHQQLGVPSK